MNNICWFNSQTNDKSINGTLNGEKGTIFFNGGFGPKSLLRCQILPSPTQLELEHIINKLKWYTTCNFKPAFWINYSLWKCHWWRTAQKLCARTESEQSSLLFKRLYISESVSTSLPNPNASPAPTPTPKRDNHRIQSGCEYWPVFLQFSREQLTFKTQE